MALLSFPVSPANGDLYPVSPLAGQNQYEWSAPEQTWRLLGVAIGATPGTYGDSANIPQITVDAQGRVTSAVNIATNAPVIVAAPTTQSDPGVAGNISFDSSWIYWYDGAAWQRAAADATPW